MFGTLFVPRRRERLVFGIDPDETERMQSVSRLYFELFRDARRLVRARRLRRAA